MLELVQLSVVPVINKEDPEYLKKIFGSFPSNINLAHDNFPHLTDWPEIKPDQKLGIVRFKDEIFPNWEAVDQRLTAEGYGPDKRTLPPHLAQYVVPKCDALWKIHQDGKGPSWVFASDPKSVWRAGDNLYLPFVSLHPTYRRVRADRVGRKLGDDNGFLVVCE